MPLTVFSQQKLDVRSAVNKALANNLQVQIARNEAKISQLQNTFGYAGGLPSLAFSANDNNSMYNLHQKLSNGTETEKNNVISNSLNAGLTANYTLFNGFKMWASKERLNQLQQMGETQLNLSIQNTIAAVMIQYFEVYRQLQYLELMNSNLLLSEKKLEIIQTRKINGMSNQTDILQAEIDINNLMQGIKQMMLTVEDAKLNLLQIMGERTYYDFTIADTIILGISISADSVKNFVAKNPELLLAEQNINVYNQLLKESKASLYPSLKMNAGYNFSYSGSTAGFNLLTNSYGPALGASLQVPIFNGNIYKTQIKTTQLRIQNAELEKSDLEFKIKSDIDNLFQNYQIAAQQLELQRQTVQKAESLLDISMLKFGAGELTILELKEAQQLFENAKYQFVNLNYSAKVIEIQLLRYGCLLN